MKTVKKISLLTTLLAAILTLSSCSSGGTSGNGALNLTGRWDGSVTTSFGFTQATMTISQDKEATLVGDFTFDAVMVIPDFCIISIENATINGRTRSFSGIDSEFSFVGIASNNEITGDIKGVSDDDEDEPTTCDFVNGAFQFKRV